MGFLFIQSTNRNTKITVTDIMLRPRFWWSSGKSGFKGCRRSTKHAAETTARQAGLQAIQLGIHSVQIVLIGNCRSSAIPPILIALNKSGLKIISIRDKTRIPHNGCRPPKRRRV